MQKLIAVLLLPLVAGGCVLDFLGLEGKTKVQTQLMRARPSPSSAAGLNAVSGQSGANAGLAATSQMTLHSVRAPIIRIAMGQVGSSRADDTIYECKESGAACLVELTGEAYTNLLPNQVRSISAGSYDKLRYEVACRNDGTYDTHIKATVLLGGQTYYTKAAGGLSTQAPAEEARVTHSGCAREFRLPQAVQVRDTSDIVPVSLYFDLAAFARAGLPEAEGSGWVPGGCSAKTAPWICVAYPDLGVTIGSSRPIVEHYLVQNSTLLGLYFTADGNLLSGYSRRWLEEGVTPTFLFVPDAPLMDGTKNPDGSYRINQLSNNPAGSPLFPAFRRVAEHSGVLNDVGTTRSYTAVRFTPPGG